MVTKVKIVAFIEPVFKMYKRFIKFVLGKLKITFLTGSKNYRQEKLIKKQNKIL